MDTVVVCEQHPFQLPVEDYSTGDIVCKSCGLVLVQRAVCDQPDWVSSAEKPSTKQRCLIQDPNKQQIAERIKSEYVNSDLQIKRFKQLHEIVIDVFFSNFRVESHIENLTKNNFLTFKKIFSNVNLEILLCSAIHFTLEQNGYVVPLEVVATLLPNLLSLGGLSTATRNKILKIKRKMEEYQPQLHSDIKFETYLLNFTDRLSSEGIIQVHEKKRLIELFTAKYIELKETTNINSKTPLQTTSVISIFLVLTGNASSNPKDLLRALCNIAGIRDSSIIYWMNTLKK